MAVSKDFLYNWQNINHSSIGHLIFFRMYPPGGFTNLLQSNTTPENFHLVGNTRSDAASSPTTPSLRRSLPVESDAQDKETINIEVDETNEDERTEKRLNWTKPEDVRLVSIWFLPSFLLGSCPWKPCIGTALIVMLPFVI
jgi:hypothetical protein